LLKDYSRALGEKAKYVSLEIYWSVVGTILKYSWRKLNVIFNKSPRSIISPICFQLKGIVSRGDEMNKFLKALSLLL
jgi:hypothetical protein